MAANGGACPGKPVPLGQSLASPRQSTPKIFVCICAVVIPRTCVKPVGTCYALHAFTLLGVDCIDRVT